MSQYSSTTPPYGIPVPPQSDVVPNVDLDPQGNFWGYLAEEDKALWFKLKGLTVADENKGARPVQVFFQYPPKEKVNRSYPFITIAFDGEEIDSDREHRGYVGYSYYYLQDQYLPGDATNNLFFGWYPIPMNLHYIVTVHCSNATHRSQLVGALNGVNYIPPRFGFLNCSGGTVRRLDRESSTPANGYDEAQARVFRQIYRVTVPSELEPPKGTATTRIEEVVLQLLDTSNGESQQTIIS